MANPATTKSKQKKIMLVRHGRMHHIGIFEHNENQIPKQPKKVVVQTDKGLELGTIIGCRAAYKSGQLKMDNEQLSEYYCVSEVDFNAKPSGKFIRYATSEDLSEDKHLKKISKEELKRCQQIAEEQKLDMKLVEVEHIFGGERIIFYFKADARIDFRELVKQLAHEYQSRIEMRQIGARDEAKLLGDIETCGQQCCCIRFLQVLKPVNMRMAKMQKATLDPSKISGYCGRLKCCLRYEDETYNELKKRLPRKRALVKTKQGTGKVIDTQLLTQIVVIELENSERIAVNVEDIEILDKPERTVPKEPAKKDFKPIKLKKNNAAKKAELEEADEPQQTNETQKNNGDDTQDNTDKPQQNDATIENNTDEPEQSDNEQQNNNTDKPDNNNLPQQNDDPIENDTDAADDNDQTQEKEQ